MKREVFILILASVLLIPFGFWTYFAMDDLGLFDGSYHNSTLAKVSSYIGAGFTAVRLWTFWKVLMWLVHKVIILGIILFIIAGIGIILGL